MGKVQRCKGAIIVIMKQKSLREPMVGEKQYLSDLVYNREQVEERARVCAEEIRKKMQEIDYLVCVMQGAWFWANLLSEKLNYGKRVDVELSFYHRLQVSLESDQQLESLNWTNSRILIVENIVATGRTLAYILATLNAQGPKQIGVCTMFNKPGVRHPEFVDVNSYLINIGFTLSKEKFVVGYGNRGLPPLPDELRYLENIYRVKQEPESYRQFTAWGNKDV